MSVFFRPNGDMYDNLETDLEYWIEEFVEKVLGHFDDWNHGVPVERSSDLVLYGLKQALVDKVGTEFSYQIKKRRDNR